MLSLKRKINKEIHILPFEDIDPEMKVSELFKDGAFIIKVVEISGGQVKLGVEVPKCLNIVREELFNI